MLVDFGKTRTGIGIVYHGTLMYTSTIDIGGDQLSQVLRKNLVAIIRSRSYQIKNTVGLVRGRLTRWCVTLISTISVVKDELVTRMQYWHLKMVIVRLEE